MMGSLLASVGSYICIMFKSIESHAVVEQHHSPREKDIEDLTTAFMSDVTTIPTPFVYC